MHAGSHHANQQQHDRMMGTHTGNLEAPAGSWRREEERDTKAARRPVLLLLGVLLQPLACWWLWWWRCCCCCPAAGPSAALRTACCMLGRRDSRVGRGCGCLHTSSDPKDGRGHRGRAQ